MDLDKFSSFDICAREDFNLVTFMLVPVETREDGS